MRRADEFKGMQVRRQMVYADLSLSIYDRDPAQVDVQSTAKSMVEKYQPIAFVEGNHFPCSFGHLDGYSAVYYTYMWSLVIAKDLFSAFNPSNLRSDDRGSLPERRPGARRLGPGGEAGGGLPRAAVRVRGLPALARRRELVPLS